jgi:hypothetical protein
MVQAATDIAALQGTGANGAASLVDTFASIETQGRLIGRSLGAFKGIVDFGKLGEKLGLGKGLDFHSLTEALTDHPVVRFIGSDNPERTDAGLAGWQPIVADWVRDRRTPTFFVHTPDNLESPALARSFHAAVAESVAGAVTGLEALPDPPEVDPSTGQESLF